MGLQVENNANLYDQLKIINPTTGTEVTVYTKTSSAAKAKVEADKLRAFINAGLTEGTADAYLRGSNRSAAQGGVDAFGNPIDDVVEEETTTVPIPRTFPTTGSKI